MSALRELLEHQEMKRNITIEIMKAFGILGIVLLHSNDLVIGQDHEFAFVLRAIATKSLLFLSGYVIYGKVGNFTWVTEKIVRRIPMIILFVFIYWILGTYVSHVYEEGNFLMFYSYMIISGFSGTVLWYIWTIVISYVGLLIFEKITPKVKKIPYTVKFLIAVILLELVPMSAFGIRIIKWYALFLFAGYIFHHLHNKFEGRRIYGITKSLSLLALVLAPLILWSQNWLSDYSSEFYKRGYLDLGGAVMNGETSIIFINYSIILLCIIALYHVSNLISKTKVLAKPFVIIGGATIGIMLLHKPLLEIFHFDQVWTTFLYGTAVSFTIYKLLALNKYTKLLLFGEGDFPVKFARRITNKLTSEVL